jgi:hypothetical protein
MLSVSLVLTALCGVKRSMPEWPAKLLQSQHSSCLRKFSMRSRQARHLSRWQCVIIIGGRRGGGCRPASCLPLTAIAGNLRMQSGHQRTLQAARI